MHGFFLAKHREKYRFWYEKNNFLWELLQENVLCRCHLIKVLIDMLMLASPLFNSPIKFQVDLGGRGRLFWLAKKLFNQQKAVKTLTSGSVAIPRLKSGHASSPR